MRREVCRWSRSSCGWGSGLGGGKFRPIHPRISLFDLIWLAYSSGQVAGAGLVEFEMAPAALAELAFRAELIGCWATPRGGNWLAWAKDSAGWLPSTRQPAEMCRDCWSAPGIISTPRYWFHFKVGSAPSAPSASIRIDFPVSLPEPLFNQSSSLFIFQ